jgi:hypothetical protein
VKIACKETTFYLIQQIFFSKNDLFCTEGGSLCILFWSFDEKNEPFFVFRLMHFWGVWGKNEFVDVVFLLFKSLFFCLYTLIIYKRDKTKIRKKEEKVDE